MVDITGIAVTRLLDDYDHSVEFPEHSPFILLYGPNGVGKTKLLELIYNLCTRNFQALSEIPFRELKLDYSDGSIMKVLRSPAFPEEDDPERETILLELTLYKSGRKKSSASLSFEEPSGTGAAALKRMLERETTWRQIGPITWRDDSDGEIAEWEDLQRRFGLPEHRKSSPKYYELPAPIRDLLRHSPAHLIATQRLLIEEAPTILRGSRRQRGRSTIAEFAEDIKAKLSRALAENSRTTQQLDRSFPSRILSTPQTPITEDEVRTHYEQQNARRATLAEIGLIGNEIDVSLPNKALTSWELNVLHTYLDDTDRKLDTFSSLVARVTLFLDIINTRFVRKSARVNIDAGIEIVRSSDLKVIPASSLSSGEQHEFVLMYDLIFNVPRGALVLIDEPEISLHVAWQKNFTRDIARIADLASLRFIIATHSPQIIHKSWDKTVQLGPSEPDEVTVKR
ncbi:AAA family ATPase [Nocardia sp. NPDC060256]|uniref:AAA family ATPase n=1 Tax=unclassified Nocardia TaxID=2637762 RepID=UPI00365B1457